MKKNEIQVSNVIDLGRARKQHKVAAARGGRAPLFKTHRVGAESQNLAERMVNVQESLEKINKLMTELKRSSRPKITGQE
ncbi:MAG: hypothetical protein AB8C84_09000 [Oligoflexales bacterium]